MTHHEVIWSVVKSLKAKVLEDYIVIALRSSEGYSLSKAKTVIGWAKQINASRSPNQSAGSCL